MKLTRLSQQNAVPLAAAVLLYPRLLSGIKRDMVRTRKGNNGDTYSDNVEYTTVKVGSATFSVAALESSLHERGALPRKRDHASY